jgi:hypothetical protein
VYSPTTNGFGCGAVGVWLADGACGMGADCVVCAQPVVTRAEIKIKKNHLLTNFK